MAKKLPEDMAMLKIVNHNQNTFYLESAAFQHHQADLYHIQQHGKQQESMYLVVRSLKINNEKIVGSVILLVDELLLLLDRTMKFKSETFSKSAESNSPSKKSATPTSRWTWTPRSRKKKAIVLTASSLIRTRKSSKSSLKCQPRCKICRMRTQSASADFAGILRQARRTLSSALASAQVLSARSTSAVCQRGCKRVSSPNCPPTFQLTSGRRLSARFAGRLTP